MVALGPFEGENMVDTILLNLNLKPDLASEKEQIGDSSLWRVENQRGALCRRFYCVEK